jgi:hypothetical protein
MDVTNRKNNISNKNRCQHFLDWTFPGFSGIGTYQLREGAVVFPNQLLS